MSSITLGGCNLLRDRIPLFSIVQESREAARGDRQCPVHPKRISFSKAKASDSVLSCLEQPTLSSWLPSPYLSGSRSSGVLMSLLVLREA